MSRCHTLADVAALFVERYGVYAYDPNVDVWDIDRDARLYDGTLPVIAHPPCQRWCRLAGLVQARWGYRKGDDGGCFKSALASVRRCGGVLEHPAFSDAFHAFDLPIPSYGGWTEPDKFGGRSCYIEQGRYGHLAKKATWLYAVRCYADMSYGRESYSSSQALVSFCGNHTSRFDKRRRISKKIASSTPYPFRDALLAMARQVKNLTRT